MTFRRLAFSAVMGFVAAVARPRPERSSRAPTALLALAVAALQVGTAHADDWVQHDDTEFLGTPFEMLIPDRLRTIDAEALRAAIGEDPGEWIDTMRRTPLVGAASAWSCICARMLQLEDDAGLHRWLRTLAGGPDREPETWLAIDAALPGEPPHHHNAVTYGAAISGCIVGLQGLADSDPAAANARVRGMLEAVGAGSDPDAKLPDLNEQALLHKFWPDALNNSTLFAAYALGFGSNRDRLTCQQEIRVLWTDWAPARRP